MLPSCPECGSKNILVNSTAPASEELPVTQKLKQIMNVVCKPFGGKLYWKCLDCHKEGCIIVN